LASVFVPESDSVSALDDVLVWNARAMEERKSKPNEVLVHNVS
jgi:hypothetical protein